MKDEKRQQIIDLIKAMSDEGVSKKELKDTLKESGLPEEEIEKVLDKAKPQPTTADVHSKVEDLYKAVSDGDHVRPAVEAAEKAAKSTEDIGSALQEVHGQVEEQAGKMEEIGSSLTDHKDKLEEISRGMSDISEKNERMTEGISSISNLQSDIRMIKEMLIEMKPLISSLTDLNEKVLETNRAMLMRLRK